MCGRYSLVCIDDLGNRFRVYNPMIGYRSHFNVAPSQEMPVIVQHEHTAMVLMKWGLVPHGLQDPQSSPRPINAKAETLFENLVFRDLVNTRRCLVPASGFYEWKTAGTKKIPFYFHLKGHPIFAFAGLYDIWRDASGQEHPTYTILTTVANDLMKPIHNRMPVILQPEDEVRWLTMYRPTPGELNVILAPYAPDAMESYPVSSRVNSPRADDEKLITPLRTL